MVSTPPSRRRARDQSSARSSRYQRARARFLAGRHSGGVRSGGVRSGAARVRRRAGTPPTPTPPSRRSASVSAAGPGADNEQAAVVQVDAAAPASDEPPRGFDEVARALRAERELSPSLLRFTLCRTRADTTVVDQAAAAAAHSGARVGA